MHIHSLHLLHFKPDIRLKEIYISIFIRALAISMIGIFIPIYLIREVNYSLQNVLWFYIIFSVTFGILTPFSAKIFNKIGFKYCILISAPIYLLFYILLYYLTQININLYYIAIIGGLANSFYWISFHSTFAKYSDHDHIGEQIGIWYSIAIFIGLLGPLIGGIILTFLDYRILFILVTITLILSVIPIFMIKVKHEKQEYHIKNIFKKNNLADVPGFIGYGARGDSQTVLLPLFAFFLLKKYLQLGFISSGVGFFTALFAFVIGRTSDIQDKRKLIRLGSFLAALSWIILLFAKNLWQLFIIATLAGISYTMIDVPFSALTYDKANKNKSAIEYLVFREICLSCGRILLLSLVLIFDDLSSGFVFSAIGTLLHLTF
ncbi:MAG: MFS transporter [Candidatus Woesearchaeota archaeon]